MKKLCKLTQSQLKDMLYDYLLGQYKKVIKTNDYILAEGTLPICLVAHLDTVFKQPPREIFYDQFEKVMWSPQGLGADDRAGVYAILEIISNGYKPSVIFTTDEEMGAEGARKLIKDYPECPFQDLKAMIELDRRGCLDCVFYECDNPDFEEYIEEFGFVTNAGIFSDISVIAPEWGIAAVNLSVGYLDEHSLVERLYIEDLENTIQKVKCILDKSISMLNYAYIPLVCKCLICNKPLLYGDIFTHKQVCNSCYTNYYDHLDKLI
jgi:di/tripeptidase